MDEKQFIHKTFKSLTESGVTINHVGDGGNKDTFTVTAKGDQYGFANFEKTEDGFILKIIGCWEFSDFKGAVNLV